MNDCCNIYEVAELQFEISKDEKYYYIVNNYNTPISLFSIGVDPNKNFITRENAIKYLNKALVKHAKQILKELK